MITITTERSPLFDTIVFKMTDCVDGFIPNLNDIKELAIRTGNNILVKTAYQCKYHLANYYVCKKRNLSDIADFIDYDEIAEWLLANDNYVELSSGTIIVF